MLTKIILFVPIILILVGAIIARSAFKQDQPTLNANYVYFSQDKQLTKHFKLSELWDRGYVVIPNVFILAKWLQELRNIFLKAITILCATRTPEHNTAVSGADKSWHLLSLAIDPLVKNDIEKYQLEGIAIKLGWGGIGRGVQGKNKLHLDLRNLFNQSARWFYD